MLRMFDMSNRDVDATCWRKKSMLTQKVSRVKGKPQSRATCKNTEPRFNIHCCLARACRENTLTVGLRPEHRDVTLLRLCSIVVSTDSFGSSASPFVLMISSSISFVVVNNGAIILSFIACT